VERAQARWARTRRQPAATCLSGRPSAGRLGLCGAIALAAALLSLSPAGSASAAAPPTGDAGASIAIASTGTVAGSVDAGEDHTCGVQTNGTLD
jgi:hypothetical protein